MAKLRFRGKYYQPAGTAKTKAEANKKATELRKAGHSVHIIYSAESKKYLLWSR